MTTSWKIAIPAIVIIVLVLIFGYFFFAGQEKPASEIILEQNLPVEYTNKAKESKTGTPKSNIPVATGNIDDIVNAALFFSDNEQTLANQEAQAVTSTADNNQEVNNYLNIYDESEY